MGAQPVVLLVAPIGWALCLHPPPPHSGPLHTKCPYKIHRKLCRKLSHRSCTGFAKLPVYHKSRWCPLKTKCLEGHQRGEWWGKHEWWGYCFKMANRANRGIPVPPFSPRALLGSSYPACHMPQTATCKEVEKYKLLSLLVFWGLRPLESTLLWAHRCEINLLPSLTSKCHLVLLSGDPVHVP